MSNQPAHVGTKTSSATRLELKIASDPANLAEVRKQVEAFCGQSGLDETACGDVGLCVNEAMANVIRHAYAGATDRPILVTAERIHDGRRDGVIVSIRDWGNGFNPEALVGRPHDKNKPGGLGLICIREMLDGFKFEPQPDGMLLMLTRYQR